MFIFTKRLDEVGETDLQELVDQKFSESKTVEYKERLSVGSESDRKKFLSQVSSFANAAGGHLIYGVRAADGVPEEVVGLEIANPDGELLRLEDMVRAGVRPRIPGVLMKAVTVKTDKVAIVIRIPKSWARPHQVVFNGEYRFYSRASNGKYTLDVDELRSLFALSETTAERVRSFRADRLSQVVADEATVALPEGAKTILHSVPLNAFDPATRYDMELAAQDTKFLEPLRSTGWSAPTYNFDGVYTSSSRDQVEHSYLQVFRSGIVEAANTSLLEQGPDEQKFIASVPYEEALLFGLRRILDLQKRLGVEPPVVVMLSLLGVKGYMMYIPMERRFGGGRPIDRDALLIPERLVEDLDADVDTVLRPVFDALWNATGWPGSINFDELGKWVGRRR
jgi:hypothetical protein